MQIIILFIPNCVTPEGSNCMPKREYKTFDGKEYLALIGLYM